MPLMPAKSSADAADAANGDYAVKGVEHVQGANCSIPPCTHTPWISP